MEEEHNKERLIPEQARPGQGMRSSGASLRALQRDLGRVVVVGIAVVAVGLVAYGVHDAVAARDLYLRVAGCHAYLKLAFFARWLATR